MSDNIAEDISYGKNLEKDRLDLNFTVPSLGYAYTQTARTFDLTQSFDITFQDFYDQFTNQNNDLSNATVIENLVNGFGNYTIYPISGNPFFGTYDFSPFGSQGSFGNVNTYRTFWLDRNNNLALSMGSDYEEEANFFGINDCEGEPLMSILVAKLLSGNTASNLFLSSSLQSAIFDFFLPMDSEAEAKNNVEVLLPTRTVLSTEGVELVYGENSAGAGFLTTFNNSVPNLTINTLDGGENSGAVVGYDQGNPEWFIFSDQGNSQLIIDQVNTTTQLKDSDDDTQIVYSMLSGPESAAYERGTGQLINGEGIVICSDHFGQVADPSSMTVTITPLSADSKGIAVIEKTSQGFKVKELHGGTGNYSFDYMVMCKRSSYKNHKVYQKMPNSNEVDTERILKRKNQLFKD